MTPEFIVLGTFGEPGYTTPPLRTISLTFAHQRLCLPAKYPEESIDYKIDWAARLGGDPIATAIIVITAGAITVTRVLYDQTTVAFWVSGGMTGVGATVRCLVTTLGGRQFEEKLPILCI